MRRVCFVTGCSEERGFGRLIVEELSTREHTVVATMRDVGGRNAAAAEELACRDGVEVVELDVTDDGRAERVVTEAIERHGWLDAIVNNAALVRHGPLEHVTPQMLRDVLDTNVVGPHRLIRAALPHMRERRSGVIVQISSISGFSAAPLMGSYSASKFALEGYSEALAWELGHFGIRVVLIEPSGFSTGVHDRAIWEPGTEDGPYAELKRAWWDADLDVWVGEMEDPEIVARAVVDAIEDAGTPLHVPVGRPAVQRRPRYRPIDDDTLRREAMEGVEW